MWTFDVLRSGGSSRDSSGLAATTAKFLPGLICLAALAWPVIIQGVGRLYELQEVKPQVFVWIPEDIIEQEGDPGYPRAGNAGFIGTSEGVVAVDATNSPYHAREVLYEIREKTGLPVRYLVDTGGSGDEVLGNEVFADLRIPILSTPAIQAEIRDRAQTIGQRLTDEKFGRRFRGIHITPPNQTFQGQTDVSLGGQTIRLIPFDSSLHALAVDLPSARVVFLGDLFQNRYFPRLESRDLGRWIDALRQAEGWNADIYVPGHGEPGTRKEVNEFRAFLESLRAEVQAKIAQGKSLDQVQSEVTLKDDSWHARELAPGLVEGVYQQLSASVKNSAAIRRCAITSFSFSFRTMPSSRNRDEQSTADADRLFVPSPKAVIVDRFDIPAERMLTGGPKHKVERDLTRGRVPCNPVFVTVDPLRTGPKHKLRFMGQVPGLLE